MRPLTAAALFDRLRRRTRANAARVDREILERHTRELAVMMCDSSGFSRKTQEFGILQFLAVMTKCYDRLIPIAGRKGTVVSHRADNILAVFDDPGDAVAAAAEMHRKLRGHNRGKPARERFNLCIGIHFGPVVRLADDVFGATVNAAAKIGEDLAARDETLVTREVADRVRGRFRCSYARTVTLGGHHHELFRVLTR